ncbi:outer membrane protein [Poseidonocella sp. HB161398]|uniref:outer membrane protein n=1 Tax=Poseidonocella sp. HB161398 TaxID=2320855 RepID=UPI0011085D7E|nr:outer membrane beta-barrel protein [Poseidonocella sp. HB161398]
MTLRTITAALAATCALMAAGTAQAEFEISVYSGWQTSPHSTVEGSDPSGIGDFDFTAGWEGRSSEMPPYWGVRGTWWRSDILGYGLEFTHAKVYADDDTLKDNGFETLEFTDGLNIITANVMRRFPGVTRDWTPYVGAGLGIAVPHVEVETTGDKTFEYQFGGPAVSWVAGVSYPINDSWKIFGEYKGSYSQNKVDLDGGGDLETNIVTNALNVGVSFAF